MTANLVLHWHLDALTPESQALDTTDNHLNGMVKGDPKNLPDGRFGSVLELNGSTDSLGVADTPVLRVSTYTVEAWLNPSPSRPAAAAIIGKPPADVRVVLTADGSLRHRFSTSAHADDGHATAAGAVGPGAWTHVAVTNDGSTARIFLDGVQAAEYAFTGARTVAQVPLLVGTDGRTGFYQGLLAHVRIYDGALSALEIQRDMADDEAALAAFVRSTPIGFSLTNSDQQAVLYIDDSPAGQPMTLEITNSSRQDIVPQPIPAGPSAKDHHFALHLRAGTLAATAKPRVTNPGWALLRAADPATGGTVLYLRSADPPVLAPGESYGLKLEGLTADGAQGTRGTRVELTYQRMRYSGEQDELTGHRVQFLDVVNHRGRRQIPLAVGFVGGNRVLSDGVTASELRVRITNLSRDTALPLTGASFTVSYDVQEAGETHEWALVKAGPGAVLGGLVTDKVHNRWSIVSESLGQRVEWTLTPQGVTELGPDGSITVTLKPVVALASLGQAAIVIGYRNVPGYQDGSVTLVVEKSPLLFAGQNTGIGTGTPAAKLQIINTSQNPNGNSLILGPTSQSNLRLGYHQDYSWVQSHGKKPLAINAIGNNVGIGTVSPWWKLSVSSSKEHLALYREATETAGGTQLYLELAQIDSPSPKVPETFPCIRFHHHNRFWHRIEGRPEGLAIKTGDPKRADLVDVYANTAVLNGLLLGPATQSSLRLGYHQDYSWVQSQGNKPLALNATGNNVGIGTVSPWWKLSVSSSKEHLALYREATETAGGTQLFLELAQIDSGPPKVPETFPCIRFHHHSRFWHRIEAQGSGLHVKTGDPASHEYSDIRVRTVTSSALRIGAVTIGERELTILQKLAAGQLQFDLWNVEQNEYAYAADYKPFDNDRRRVFTWRHKGERVRQGRWQISFPGWR